MSVKLFEVELSRVATLPCATVPATKKLQDFSTMHKSIRLSFEQLMTFVDEIEKSNATGEYSCVQQRNHAYDVDHSLASHITKNLSPTHAKLSFAYFKEKWSVVDGNHRLYVWRDPLKVCSVPAFVEIDMYFVNTLEELTALYSTFDSKQAVKNGEDNVTSAIRMVLAEKGLPLSTFKSESLVSGKKMVSVLKALGGVHSTKFDVLVSAIHAYYDALVDFDTMNFKPKTLAGIQLATIRLLQSENTRMVKNFINDVRLAYESKSAVGIDEAEEACTELKLAHQSDIHCEKVITRDAKIVEKWFMEYKAACAAKSMSS